MAIYDKLDNNKWHGIGVLFSNLYDIISTFVPLAVISFKVVSEI